ncbi:MAG: class I SAM-dependent methyltransferase [Elusimicrobia bacterium]|nr:class I SAM-dependent methyltransferase [Candidatus Liberimonas magnetica]
MEEEKIIKMLSDLKHRVFPRPFERLAVSGKNLTGVEIGVYKADHAESLLENLDIRRLYLVDPYNLYGDYDAGKAHYGIDQDPLELAKKEAVKRLSRFSDKISWVYKKSSDSMNDIPDGLDFVYLDGNHGEAFVNEELINFYPKIRKGGVIGGHDFYNGFCREHDGVVQAVTKYAVKNGLVLQVELPDWWIIK